MKNKSTKQTNFSIDYSDLDIPKSLSSDTLKNVFAAAGKEPNKIPVEVLELKSHRRSRAMHILTVVAAVLTLLLIVTAIPVLIQSCGSSSTGTVQNVETVLPIHTGDYKDGSNLVISLKQGTYQIDWAGIYAMNEDGIQIDPTAVNETKGIVTFPMNQGNLNIYIPDVKGNVLHLLLTSS